jgi:hypothetical protein
MSINIQETFQRMPLGEKIILIAAPLFFIDSFLPWFKYGDGGPSRSAWSGDFSFFSIIAVIAVIGLFGLIVAMRFGNIKMPDLPQGVTWPIIYLAITGYVGLVVILRMILGESIGFLGVSVDADRSFGIFLAIPLAGAMIAGAGLLFQESQQGGGAITSNIGSGKVCGKCGTRNPTGATACSSCGNPMG